MAPDPCEMDLKDTYWVNVVGVSSVHVLALSALIPWLFSWAAVIAAVLTPYLYGTQVLNVHS